MDEPEQISWALPVSFNWSIIPQTYCAANVAQWLKSVSTSASDTGSSNCSYGSQTVTQKLVHQKL